MEVFYQLQFIPIFALITYILYYSYYYAAPTIHLRILTILALRRHHCKDVQISEDRVRIRIVKDGVEHVLERKLHEELGSRFWVTDICTEMRGMLKEIRRGT